MGKREGFNNSPPCYRQLQQLLLFFMVLFHASRGTHFIQTEPLALTFAQFAQLRLQGSLGQTSSP